MVDIREREKVAREIERTVESIRKKHRALKTGRIEEDIATKSRFKPIIEPLQKIVDSSRAIKDESRDVSVARKREKDATRRTRKSGAVPSVTFASRDVSAARKREREEEEEEEDEEDTIMPKRTFATPRKSDISHAVPLVSSTPFTTIRQPIEDVLETTDDLFKTAIQHEMPEGRKAVHAQLGPLGQEYIGDFLSRGENDKIIDTTYGVRLDKDGTMMLGSKKFDVDSTDHIIIDDVRYAGTPGLYELIFKKIPDEDAYTEDDKRKYKSILLATNAHRRDYTERGHLRASRAHKYRYVIMPLLKGESKIGKGLPRAMTLNDNAIDYVHWDDPNELVDRLRLLDASRRAGNNTHDNEMLSIIEELREAGFIIN